MIAPVRSQADVVRWTIVQTLLAFLLVFPTTTLTTLCLFGGDLGRSIDGSTVMRVCLASSFVQVFAFAPVVAMRSAGALLRLSQSRDALERAAYVDPLTGLMNRRGFDMASATAMNSAEGRREPVAVLMCDLDCFKAVNDRFGHDFGDAALRHVADILRSKASGKSVVVGRQGGEEFVVLLTEMARPEVIAFADALRQAVAARPIEQAGKRTTVTMSFGFSMGFAHEASLSQLAAEADKALFEAKQRGRNCVAEARHWMKEAA